ncbi:MAG: dihydroorotase [Gammaproteobacteria bacterium]|nr:dihydroorotase [Gammaproteobacteria bacterium]
MRITIANGRILDPANKFDQRSDLHIASGRIVAIGAAPAGFTPDQTIDARERLVCPGLVDLSARLREPGYEHKATIATETRAAAAAGITTLACPPDTQPVIDTPAVIKLIRHRAEEAGKARVVCLGAATQGLKGERISEMAALKQAGCAGISNSLIPIANPLVMRRIMEYAATFDITVFLFAEDPSLRNSGCMHEGAVSTRLGLPGIPEAAETVAVARDLALIADTGVRAHFCRLSSSKAVQMIARAQYDGLRVSADVSAHHLYLTEMDVADFNSQCHVRPPLRNQRDMIGLREGLISGVISAICSDHQPHENDAKLAPFRETGSGISALETLLPLSLRLADETNLSLLDILSRLTIEPARILGLDVGTLGIGAIADVIVVDPNHYWTINRDSWLSRGQNTPFTGWDLKGRVTHTLFEGRLVHELNA